MSDGTGASGMAEQWISQTLAADSQLAALIGTRIYADVAPEGTQYPCVVYLGQAGTDTTALGMKRTLSRQTYAVKVIGQAVSRSALDPIATRVDAALQGGNAVLSGGPILGCLRLSTTTLADVWQGVLYRQLIQTYQIHLKETANA